MKNAQTMGLAYNGNRLTSLSALLAISVDSNETNACPRMRKLRCAVTSRTLPYDLNSALNVAFMTRTMKLDQIHKSD